MNEKEFMQWKLKQLTNNLDEMRDIAPDIFVQVSEIIDNIYWFYATEQDALIKKIFGYSNELLRDSRDEEN